jgi:hypothetical protein
MTRSQHRIEWEKAYRQRPEVRAKIKEYRRKYKEKPEIRAIAKQRHKAYRWRISAERDARYRKRHTQLQALYYHHKRFAQILGRMTACAVIRDAKDLAQVTARALKEKQGGRK